MPPRKRSPYPGELPAFRFEAEPNLKMLATPLHLPFSVNSLHKWYTMTSEFNRRPQNLLVRRNQCQPIALSLTVIILRNQIRHMGDSPICSTAPSVAFSPMTTSITQRLGWHPYSAISTSSINPTSDTPSTSKKYPGPQVSEETGVPIIYCIANILK